MNRRNMYIGIVLIACIILGGVYAVAIKKQTDVPKTIEWRSANALPKSWSNGRDYTWFSLQNNIINCMGNPMPEANVATFKVSSLGAYGKDKNNVYWCSQIVANFDPATFTVINEIYGKDASHVVYGGYYLVPGADSATFSIIPSPQFESGYAKDKDHVYSLYTEVPKADPKTFVILPPLVPKDKNWIYSGAEVIGPASLITDNAAYANVLPAECNPADSEPIKPQTYPPAFSADGSVIGYSNYSRVCVIDKKANTIQNFLYGTEQSVSLSKDGSKVLYFKYQSEGAAINGETCADCGQYSFDRATGKVEKLPFIPTLYPTTLTADQVIVKDEHPSSPAPEGYQALKDKGIKATFKK